MERLEKTIFWVVCILVGGLLIGYCFGNSLGLNMVGVIIVVIIISVVLILNTATENIKGKWKKFGIRTGIIILAIFVVGGILRYSINEEALGKFTFYLILYELIVAVTSKEKVEKIKKK